MPTDMDDSVLMMWGHPENIMAARNDLHALLEHVQYDIERGIRKVGGWTKIKAMPTDRRQEIIDKMIMDYRIDKMYRLPPPQGFRFPAVGIFIWPSKELDPQKVWGAALEGFDRIRFDQKVYILLDRKRNMFRILGDDIKSVETAVDRISGRFCEAVAIKRKPTKMCLVLPPSLDLDGTMVMVNENHDLINRQLTVKRMEGNKGIQVYLGGPKPNHTFIEMWKTRGDEMRKANVEFIRKALHQALQDVAYYRGHIRLRVHIGKMVFFGYRRSKTGSYEFEDFSSMVRNPQTTCEVVRTLGGSKYGITDKDTAFEITELCRNRPNIFYPVDLNPDVDRSDGVRIEPQISATFSLRLNNEEGHCQDLRLEVSFQRHPGKKTYHPVRRRWLSGRNSSSADIKPTVSETFDRPKGPLDLKVIDLEADLAYQIELTRWPLYEMTEKYPIFQEFIRRLGVEEIPDEFSALGNAARVVQGVQARHDTRPTIHRVSFVNLPGLSVAGVIQKTKWRYWMAQSSYVLELTRYENLPVGEVSTIFPDGVPISYRGIDTPFDSRYGCSVWNDQWDEKLSQQSVAEVGTRGSWEPDVKKFFSSSGAARIDSRTGGWGDDGVLEFMGRIKEALDVIKRAQENAIVKTQAHTGAPPVPNTNANEWTGNEEFDT